MDFNASVVALISSVDADLHPIAKRLRLVNRINIPNVFFMFTPPMGDRYLMELSGIAL